MSPRKATYAAAILISATLTVSLLSAQVPQQPPERPDSPQKSRLERLAEELACELTPYAEDRSLDSLSVENAGETEFDIVVLGEANPMISDDCYKLALKHAAERLQAIHPELSLAEAMQKGVIHVHEEKEHAKEHGRTYGEFFQHVSQCDDWCKPMVVNLEKCHIEAVATLRPWAVFFDYDSEIVRSNFDPDLARVIEEVAANEDRQVLLIGRASRLGDKIYNRELSKQRVLAVREKLITFGVAAERIKTLWFGWEPPQISETIAQEYGIGDVYAVRGARAVNQSVMMLVF
jgi:outer membrane protein OmpA-like peptidoglycan-associated protein